MADKKNKNEEKVKYSKAKKESNYQAPKTGTCVKNLFKSLISNQAAIDNRNMRWYFWLPLLILTLFLPFIPDLASGYTSDGSALFKQNNNYSLTNSIQFLLEQDYFKDSVKIGQSDNGYFLDMDHLTAQDESTNKPLYYGDKSVEFSYAKEESSIAEDTQVTYKLYRDYYDDTDGVGANASTKNPTNLNREYLFDAIGSNVNISTTKEDGTIETTRESRITLSVFYFPKLSRFDTFHDEKKNKDVTINIDLYFQHFLDNVILNKNAKGDIQRAPNSFILLAKDYMLVNVYPFNLTPSNIQLAASYSGNLDLGLQKFGAIKGKSLTETIVGSGSLNDGYTNNLCKILHEASRPFLIWNTWKQILIVLAINAGMILVGTVVIFIFYRRKSSIYSPVNFYSSFKTTLGLAFTPALLYMIFDFFMKEYSMMIFIAAMAIRCVFISTKISPPTQGEQEKPVYQARD